MKMRTAPGKTLTFTAGDWLPLPCQTLELGEAIILYKSDPVLAAEGIAMLRRALFHGDEIEICDEEASQCHPANQSGCRSMSETGWHRPPV